MTRIVSRTEKVRPVLNPCAAGGRAPVPEALLRWCDVVVQPEQVVGVVPLLDLD
jgi:hypothetical protein